jgi:L-alanine-DL-glutamate epimerase-like enolase superfamily enzyme
MSMKITRIEILRVSIPFETGGTQIGMRASLKAWQKMESLMVRVATEDGFTGWGEAFGHIVNAGSFAILEAVVAPWFIGRDSSAIAMNMEEAQRTFHGIGRTGPVMYALSAIDIALWDIAAQRAGQPLFRLLGGQNRPLRRYASLMRYGGDAEAIARNVRRAEGLGFDWIKLHENTVPAFRAARQAVAPETRIMLDVNCPWAVDEGRAIAGEIAGDDFHWLEEPVWPPEDFAGLAAVRAAGVAIAAGENISTFHDFQRLFAAGAVDFVQPSVVKIGGISAMQRIITLAQAWSVRVVPHCFFWGPAYHATAHIVATLTRPTPVETAFITLERSPHGLFDPYDPDLTLPERPGLGFEPDMDVLEHYMITRITVT